MSYTVFKVQTSASVIKPVNKMNKLCPPAFPYSSTKLHETSLCFQKMKFLMHGLELILPRKYVVGSVVM